MGENETGACQTHAPSRETKIYTRICIWVKYKEKHYPIFTPMSETVHLKIEVFKNQDYFLEIVNYVAIHSKK